MKNWLSLLLVLTLSSGNVFADRIKDLTTVAAMRSNQLIRLWFGGWITRHR
jgi:flagellar basal body P-ring protein FlgI